MTIGGALKIAANLLANSTSPELDAEVLLAYVLKCPRSELLSKTEKKLTMKQVIVYYYLILQRRRYWPISYLIGKKEFYGRDFIINKNVLVPRPDTELLVEETIIRAEQLRDKINYIIEIGTGSGCIAISLALALPRLKLIATDIDKAALRLARINAKSYGINQRIEFIAGDILEPLLNYNGLDSCLIVANPPYLLPDEITNELKFEPKTALQGGLDGLDWYKKLFKQISILPVAKQPLGLILEINPLTYNSLIFLVQNILPLCQVEVKKDFNGLNRILILTLAKNTE